MILLALDTSTTRAAVAIGREGAPIRVAPIDANPRHGRSLVPSIARLLAAEGIGPRDLDGIGVGLGPGSYTGLRIGLMAAKTMAYALGRPLVALDSLEVIARNAPEHQIRVAVAVDAQRGDAYVADFARAGPGRILQRLGPTRIEPASAWALTLTPETLVLGPALDRLGVVAWPESVAVGTSDEGHPAAANLIELTREALRAGHHADPFFLEPIYLRRSAAEDQWERKR